MMGAMEANKISALERKAREIRGLTIEEIGYLGTGHIGGALSVVDILVLLYERVMRIDPKILHGPSATCWCFQKAMQDPRFMPCLQTRAFSHSIGF